MKLSKYTCFWTFLVTLVWAGMVLAGGPEQSQGMFGGQQKGAPWWVVLAIIVTPGGVAVVLNIGCAWLVRRVNRDTLKRKEMGPWTLIKWAFGLGALYGPLVQWAFQRIVSDLTGLPIYWELVILAPFITGPASMIVFEFILMPYLFKKRRGLYEILKVRHDPEKGHVGKTPPGELTTLNQTGQHAVQNGDDKTIPNS